MVTNAEMRGVQGWFLKRLGCFPINQISPSLSALRYAVDLIIKKRQLVIFPEGRINKYRKKFVLKEGLFRLAALASKKTSSITIIPVGIAYSEINPKFRSKVSLCYGEPLIIDKNIDLSINEFNETLYEKMTSAENEALKDVGRWIHNQVILNWINKKNMKFLKLIPIIFIFLGILPSSNLIYAEDKDPNSYKVLSNNNKKLTITNVPCDVN